MKECQNDNFRKDLYSRYWRSLGIIFALEFPFFEETRCATWAEVPLNRKSKRSSRMQTKDNIPQRLPNVRVDVQMIENASLCISLNFHGEPTPMRAKRSLLLLSRRSSFHGRKQNGPFYRNSCIGKFRSLETHLKFLRIPGNVPRVPNSSRCLRWIENRERLRSLRPPEAAPWFSRTLVKSIGRLARRAFRSISSPRNVIALLANPRQVSSIRSLARFGLLAFDSSTTNHCRGHARWFSKWLLRPISLSCSGIKTAINHRAICQIIE